MSGKLEDSYTPILSTPIYSIYWACIPPPGNPGDERELDKKDSTQPKTEKNKRAHELILFIGLWISFAWCLIVKQFTETQV